MFGTKTRLSIIALVLGLLLVSPLAVFADNADNLRTASQQDRSDAVAEHRSYHDENEPVVGAGGSAVDDLALNEYVSGHRSYQDEEEPTANYASISLSLIDELVREGELTTDAIRFIEENVFEFSTVAEPANVPTIADVMKRTLGIDQLTTEMIEFYEQNVWE